MADPDRDDDTEPRAPGGDGDERADDGDDRSALEKLLQPEGDEWPSPIEGLMNPEEGVNSPASDTAVEPPG